MAIEKPAEVGKSWDGIQSLASEYSLMEQEVFALVQQFRGQKVPGHLFNVDNEFTLPTFTRMEPNYRPSEFEGIEIDIFGGNEEVRWVIEVKAGGRSLFQSLNQVIAFSSTVKATPWLVVFDDIPERIREMAKQRNILVTGASEWRELKSLIESE